MQSAVQPVGQSAEQLAGQPVELPAEPSATRFEEPREARKRTLASTTSQAVETRT